MSEGTVAIVGAGLGGLSAGCYGQMSGFRTHIFEMHTLPGGVCATWRRKGYTFDGSVSTTFPAASLGHVSTSFGRT